MSRASSQESCHQLLVYYRGMKPDVDFTKLFVLNAKVLRKMIFGLANHRKDKWMANQRRRLQLDNKASRGAALNLHSNVMV